MADPVASVGLEVKIDQLRADLKAAAAAGGEGFKELAIQVDREMKKATAAIRASSKESKSQFDALDRSAGKTGQSAAKLAGALGLVSPAAADAARGVADLADVGEVAATIGDTLGVSVGALSVGLAAVTTAVAAGYLAWQVYNDEGEQQAVIAADVAAAHEALAPILESTRVATLDLKVATGELSELQGDLERNSLRAHKALLAATEESRKKIGELKEEQGSVATQLVDLAEEWTPAWSPLGAVIRATTDSSEDLQDRVDALNTTIEEAVELTREDVAVTGEVIRKKQGAKNAADALKESIAAQNRELEAENDAAEKSAATFAAAFGAMADAERKATTQFLDGAAKVQAARDDELADLEKNHQAALAVVADNASARETLEAQYQATRKAIVRSAEAEITAITKEEQDKRDKDLREAYQANVDASLDASAATIEAIGSVASAVFEEHADAFSGLTDQIDELQDLIDDLADDTVDAASLSGDALVDAYKSGAVAAEDLSEAQKAAIEASLAAEQASLEKKAALEKQAATEAFEIQQAASIAATLIAGLQGAIAAFQLGPIAGAIAAAGIAALTAVNVGLIASQKPQFHAGGVRDGTYPDELTSVTLPGEGWANRQAMNDPANRAALNAMNAGHSVGGGITVVRIGRREAREIARTDIRSNGIIPSTIKSIARRSGKGVGRSGRGVLA